MKPTVKAGGARSRRDQGWSKAQGHRPGSTSSTTIIGRRRRAIAPAPWSSTPNTWMSRCAGRYTDKSGVLDGLSDL